VTVRYVHRPAGPGTAISYAGEFQAGYAEEELDTATSTELAAFLTPPAAPHVPPSPREWLERLSADKQAAISAAAVANPAILLWLLKAAGTPQIDVTATALVSVGVLTSADQTVLLAL
jgi:hypothetical protein